MDRREILRCQRLYGLMGLGQTQFLDRRTSVSDIYLNIMNHGVCLYSQLADCVFSVKCIL